MKRTLFIAWVIWFLGLAIFLLGKEYEEISPQPEDYSITAKTAEGRMSRWQINLA
jgi:hypothetical protein